MGEKASLNIRKRYWLIVLKGKSYSCTNTKSIFGYALIVWSIIWNSFFLLLSFFHLSLFSSPFPSFFFFFFFFSLQSLFVLYIVVLVPFSLSTCESGVGGFFCPRSSLLESSTLTCKAVCLLFRYHLHINAVRELVGQHLMRR